MTTPEKNQKLAFATLISQKLVGPSEAIIGFLAFLKDDIDRNGPKSVLPDLLKIESAALNLGEMIKSLSKNSTDISQDTALQSRLRHDLRSPINAIIGYSEMILEDAGEDLSTPAIRDIKAVLNESRRLVSRVDEVVAGVEHQGKDESNQIDAKIAAGLAISLDKSSTKQGALTGHILVIDDEAANREILTRQLEGRGHSVCAVGSARETYLAMNEQRFDLVLLDILMPDTNGIEVLERLKSDPFSREIPVVMVSGLQETGAIARCISTGAEDYLPKPIDPILLHARVQACLERMQWRAREIAFTKEIEYEKDRADALLHSMLPAPVIQRLNAGETHIADRFTDATIIFADIVDFTPLVARMDATDLIKELSSVFTAFDDLAHKHDIEKIKTIGDAYMAASGIPAHREDHAVAALEFARSILEVMSNSDISKAGLQIRIGINTGPVIAGLIGRKRSVYDVWGETVNLASRLEASGRAGKIHISETTKTAVHAYLQDIQEHAHDVKGIGNITSYFVR